MEKTGRHKTLDKELKRTVQWLLGLPSVSKVVIGISESCRHKYAPGTIKWTMDMPAGIKANGYSGKGITNLFIRVDPPDDREVIKKKLLDRFPL